MEKGDGAEPYLNGTTTRDATLVDIVGDLRDVALRGAFTGAASNGLRIRVANTDFTGSSGYHRITIAYTVVRATAAED